MIAQDTMYITMYITLFRELLRYRGITVKNGHEAHNLGRPHAPCLSTLGTRIHAAASRANERANSRKQRVGTCTKYKGGSGARINFHFASFDNFISPSGFPLSTVTEPCRERQWLVKKYF